MLSGLEHFGILQDKQCQGNLFKSCECLVCVARFGDYVTREICLLYLGYYCFQVGPCATAEQEGFSHHLQGPTLKMMGYVDSLIEPHLRAPSPTSLLPVPP